MTTDITELAQREKFEAWARSQKLGLSYGDCGYVFSSTEMAWRAWMASSSELVEALEKAQKQTTESENRVRKQNRHICELFDDNTALRQRIAELESRTVKLPPKVDSSNVPFAGHAWNCCLDEVEKCLAAAGIKVEAE